jgi:hypothetical protein
VSDPNAFNDPQTITVTLQVQTVICDFNGDADVDQDDFGYLQKCASGAATYPDGCAEADLDGSGSVNQADLTILEDCLSGPNVIADKTCDDNWD